MGTFRLLKELGTGGMGTVYLAEVAANGASGQQVAVKVIHPHLVNTPRGRRRFRREGEIGRRIRHRNVVATFGVEELDVDGKPTLYLVMEYVEGQTLRSLLDELGRVAGSRSRCASRARPATGGWRRRSPVTRGASSSTWVCTRRRGATTSGTAGWRRRSATNGGRRRPAETSGSR